MSNLDWLDEDQLTRLRPYFPKIHGLNIRSLRVVML